MSPEPLRCNRFVISEGTRSNRAIAEAVGATHPFVAEERIKLESVTSIHVYVFAGGKGVSSGKHSAECWCGNGDSALRLVKFSLVRS